MLLKSLEFKNGYGQKVKILDIPVLANDNPLYFKVNMRLQMFLTEINQAPGKKVFSFRDYLKRHLKWPEYQSIYHAVELKNNA
ncbi:DUF2535 family protein [Rossellomorea vietnamensis]|uniref:DUF2535 family protein n=1 Tax=Rossellomorea vietnamensis TaxID=218284 RepID=A0A5D4MI96_9BACI|nr:MULTISPECIES: DUF2535 family protein [Bacillaceae]TYS01635.1 DUF2535 family protein [Rossellomorea vietnamensis]